MTPPLWKCKLRLLSVLADRPSCLLLLLINFSHPSSQTTLLALQGWQECLLHEGPFPYTYRNMLRRDVYVDVAPASISDRRRDAVGQRIGEIGQSLVRRRVDALNKRQSPANNASQMIPVSFLVDLRAIKSSLSQNTLDVYSIIYLGEELPINHRSVALGLHEHSCY